MLYEKDCLIYPVLQKFYSALSSLKAVNPDDYIFENIPKIDAFFQEFRNITFVMQKNFSTPELKAFYEAKRVTYLSNDNMAWFVDIRNKITKESPFKLEKAISLKIYTAANNFDEFKILLTIDSDKDFKDLLAEITNILEKHYKNCFEVFFSILVLFIENGKEIDIYEKIIEGTMTMWKFVSDVYNTYPCSCTKCKNLKKQIEEALNHIQYRQTIFIQDCCYNAGKIQIGSRINSYGLREKVFNKEDMRFDLAKSPMFGKDYCDNDIILLQRWALNHIFVAQMQLEQTKEKEPEILATFLLVYEDNTAELIGMFAGTVKTTYYRTINEVAERVKNEKIRTVLYVGEVLYYSVDKLKFFNQKSYDERTQEAGGTLLYNLVTSKQLENIMGIKIDYSQINDKTYCLNQVKNPENLGKDFLIGPIFRALK